MQERRSCGVKNVSTLALHSLYQELTNSARGSLNARVLQIQQTRGLEDPIAQTGEVFRAAEERVDALGAAMRESEAPTDAMESALADAREEAARLGAVMAEQSKERGARREKLRRTGDAVDDLADRERERTGAIEKQGRQLDKLGDLVGRNGWWSAPAAFRLPCPCDSVGLVDTRPADCLEHCAACGEWLCFRRARTCSRVRRQRLASARQLVAAAG